MERLYGEISKDIVSSEDLARQRKIEEYQKIFENLVWLLGNIVPGSPTVTKRVIVESKAMRIIGQTLRSMP